MSKFVVFVSLLVLALSVLFIVEEFKPYRIIFVNYLENLGIGFSKLNALFEKSAAGFGFKERILTKDELSKYTEETIYLAILGKVYDVTKGKRHYGKGGSYDGFAGRDGTKAFITGEFDDSGLTDDIRGFTLQEFLGLHEWQQKYETDYTYIGKLIGKFYDKNGEPTETLNTFHTNLKDAYKEKDADAADRKMFPPCNSEWSEATGKRLWCTEWSGGIHRDWVGVPRQYLRAGKNQPRCACIKDPETQHPNIKLYDHCEKTAVSCSFPS